MKITENIFSLILMVFFVLFWNLWKKKKPLQSLNKLKVSKVFHLYLWLLVWFGFVCGVFWGIYIFDSLFGLGYFWGGCPIFAHFSLLGEVVCLLNRKLLLTLIWRQSVQFDSCSFFWSLCTITSHRVLRSLDVFTAIQQRATDKIQRVTMCFSPLLYTL